jgi:glycosyltransferase involved in cell wall biosynthesis
MALLEAGCCGVPMVTFDVGGNRELIADGLSGFLVQCQDLRGLLWRSSSLLQRGLCERMQASAMQHVTQHFSTEVIAKKYLILFDSVTRITGGS